MRNYHRNSNKSKISRSCVGASKILSQQTTELKTADAVPGSVLKAGFTPSKGLLLLAEPGEIGEDKQRKH